MLDGVPVQAIDASLRAAGQTWTPQVLAENASRCFEGPSPKAKGLIIDSMEAGRLLTQPDAQYSDVVRPYLTAQDITDEPDQRPTRWAIDFGLMPLEDAAKYPSALAVARRDVLPVREKSTQKQYRAKWWQFGRPRPDMRAAISSLRRYVAMARHGKRAVYSWCPLEWLASDATKVFAFDDDFSMGVLTSRAHGAWAWFRSSTWKADLRYTNTSVFMTFPWPADATAEQRETVADVCRRLLARRSEICLAGDIGLTKLYNAMDDGAYADLKALHRELDEAVAVCYGWPKSIAQDDAELVARLTELNRQISTGERPYEPFAYLTELG